MSLEKLQLNNVTLLSIDGCAKNNLTYKALEISKRQIDFAKVKFLGVENFVEDKDIEFVQIPRMSWEEYNIFVLDRLHEFVDTDFVLLVQDDGFVLNANLWDSKFLKYDYVGAPWNYARHIDNNSPWGTSPQINYDIRKKPKEIVNLVGNGGFTIRSKKLLIETHNCPFYKTGSPEDVYICLNYYDYFVYKGIKFATIEIAKRFSVDPIFDLTKTFGFHGNKEIIKNV